MKIIGFYDKFGYTIEDESTGEVLYTAGNNPLESSSIVSPEKGLTISMIKKYCRQSGKEIAKENKGEFIGCYLKERG